MTVKLQPYLIETGLFSWLDIHFARFIGRIDGGGSPEVSLAAALLSRNQRMGHICLDLTSTEKTIPTSELAAAGITLPPPLSWADVLRGSRAVGRPAEYAPLILDDRLRLYLHRYWEYQTLIAKKIRKRAETTLIGLDIPKLSNGISRLFPSLSSAGTDETDWQKVAAFAAVTRRFSVISGGPGTGKTTTVAKILALLLEQAGPDSFRIALAAPTGKAAARLREAVSREKARIDSPFRDDIPETVSTLHRLLGSLPDSPYFRYNADHPLPVDLVVVDEASMIDVALMAKLTQAVPPQARLILLGDRDQLASVEAGAILGDICDTGNFHHFSESFCRILDEITGETLTGTPADDKGKSDALRLSDSVVLLRKSYRFGEKSGIGRLSRRINAGDGKGALEVLSSDTYPDVQWRTLPRSEDLPRAVRKTVVDQFGAYLKCIDDPASAFQIFDRFRILGVLRQGPFGVVRLNEIVEAILRAEGFMRSPTLWYPGRPVMVIRNDYSLRLFNGDVGITMTDPAGRVRVWFPDGKGAGRSFSPLRLPEHETVYAMTVHKSQGSEFNRVMLILPNQDTPVMTRELLYTGVTRAVDGVEIWGLRPLLIKAAGRPIQRTSGLRDALWEQNSP